MNGIQALKLKSQTDLVAVITKGASISGDPWECAKTFTPRLEALKNDACEKLVKDIEKDIMYTRPLAFKKIHAEKALETLTGYSERTKAASTKLGSVLDGVVKIKEAADLLA